MRFAACDISIILCCPLYCAVREVSSRLLAPDGGLYYGRIETVPEYLQLRMDDGILQYYLRGQPVHFHDQIELGLQHGRWLPVRFEWSGISMDEPILQVKLAGSEVKGWLQVTEKALFRWPEGRTSTGAGQSSHCARPMPGVQESAYHAGVHAAREKVRFRTPSTGAIMSSTTPFPGLGSPV